MGNFLFGLCGFGLRIYLINRHFNYLIINRAAGFNSFDI